MLFGEKQFQICPAISSLQGIFPFILNNRIQPKLFLPLLYILYPSIENKLIWESVIDF